MSHPAASLLLVALLAIPGCEVSSKPLVEVQRNAAARGCVRALVTLCGSPNTKVQKEGMLMFCEHVADSIGWEQ